MKLILCFLVLIFSANAGVLRVISYPLRVSPIKLFTPVVKVITFPFVHPKRFWVVAPHGPTLPPDPWADGVLVRVEGAF